MSYNPYNPVFYYSEEQFYLVSNDPQVPNNDREDNTVQPSLIYQPPEDHFPRLLLPSNITGASHYPTSTNQVPPVYESNHETSIFERLLSDGNTMFRDNGNDNPYDSTIFKSEYDIENDDNGNIDPALLPSTSTITTSPHVNNNSEDDFSDINIPPRTIIEPGSQEDKDLIADVQKKVKIGKRPSNSFMIYAGIRRKEFSAANQNSLITGRVSKLLSKEWKALPQEEKSYYQNLHKTVVLDQHKILNPGYAYTRKPNGCGKNYKGKGKGKGSKAKAEALSKDKPSSS
ncbi:hypothetical protein BDQ17DRAFT_1468582 [Cyathus striatus]|nr:hypothetical protein BDQ17DRAFT_1468582 [Cyathus striatus]